MDDVVQYCSVEEFCLHHYSVNGLPDGLHAEGAVLNSFLGLLFWDIIYMDVPDAFRDPGQALPLDWDTDNFFKARESFIQIRLAELRSLDIEEVAAQVIDSWISHFGVISLINWNLFSSEEKLRDLILCFDPVSLAAVMERMIRDHRSTRSGLPDLTVWNSKTKELKCVEVKGPGDRLSTKQILWVRFLNNSGINCEVCHVLPVGSMYGGIGKSPIRKTPIKETAETESVSVEEVIDPGIITTAGDSCIEINIDVDVEKKIKVKRGRKHRKRILKGQGSDEEFVA